MQFSKIKKFTLAGMALVGLVSFGGIAKADQVIGYVYGGQCMVEPGDGRIMRTFGREKYAVMLKDDGSRYRIYLGCE